jgi:DNA helicase HerA-like ATPase
MPQLITRNAVSDVNSPRRELTSHHFEMGNILGNATPFGLTEEQLSTHSCVLGSTGSGKSKFLELLMRYLTVGGRGFALIDPHGDLADNVLAFAGYLKASGQRPDIAKKIHYLEPSFERAFAFDPFLFRPSTPVTPESYKNAYSAWLRAKADRVAEIFQRKQSQASFEGMPRLQRVLGSV